MHKKIIAKALTLEDIHEGEKTTLDAVVDGYLNIGDGRAKYVSTLAPVLTNGWLDSLGPEVRYQFTISAITGVFAIDDVVDCDGWEGVIRTVELHTYSAQDEIDGLGTEGDPTGIGCLIVQATYPCTVSIPSQGENISVTAGAAATADEITCEW